MSTLVPYKLKSSWIALKNRPYVMVLISILKQGQGYSLPADIQYVDARWEIPVVLPLRDCFAQEINMYCRLDRYNLLHLTLS
ncbi:cytoplasmic tRNA 2-thiolation protein 2-like, partial [Trifolium medium]|nr:cytoplasmic tRNA 2-thiolation protein 2-like [Trifolium medium]